MIDFNHDNIIIDRFNNISVKYINAKFDQIYLAINFKSLLIQMKQGQINDFERHFMDLLMKPIDEIKRCGIINFILTPDYFQSIGHGALSVVIKPLRRDAKTVFKYTRVSCDNENKIKKNLNRKIEFPSIPFIDNDRFVSSEYAENGTLAEYLQKNQDLTNLSLMTLFKEICNCIMEIHSNDILMRDIKPENILIDENQNPIINDFDTAVNSISSVDGFAGTPLYMAPEVLNLKSYGYRADIYSLGLVLYYMFARRPPPMERHLLTFPPPVPESIITLITKMTETNPDDRITNDNNELNDEIEKCIREFEENEQNKLHQQLEQADHLKLKQSGDQVWQIYDQQVWDIYDQQRWERNDRQVWDIYDRQKREQYDSKKDKSNDSRKYEEIYDFRKNEQYHVYEIEKVQDCRYCCKGQQFSHSLLNSRKNRHYLCR